MIRMYHTSATAKRSMCAGTYQAIFIPLIRGILAGSAIAVNSKL